LVVIDGAQYDVASAPPRQENARNSTEYAAIGDQLPFYDGRPQSEIEALFRAKGLVAVGGDPVLDWVEAQSQRMIAEGGMPRRRQRYVVWGERPRRFPAPAAQRAPQSRGRSGQTAQPTHDAADPADDAVRPATAAAYPRQVAQQQHRRTPDQQDDADRKLEPERIDQAQQCDAERDPDHTADDEGQHAPGLEAAAHGMQRQQLAEQRPEHHQRPGNRRIDR